ncbi:MAG: P-loop NTPase [Acetobacteraceae bacterium]
MAPPPTAELPPIEIGRKVVAFVADEITEAALRTGLAVLGAEFDLRRGTIRQAIRYFEREAPAHAIIVDISGEDNPQAVLDDLARVCPPDVRVFVIGDNNEISFYRLLVQDLGVSEYLPKPLSRDAVQRLLLSHLGVGITGATGMRGGHLIAVCGARGGVGTSSIALNLAYELMGRIKGHVALVDFHVQGGEIALMLSAHPGPGLRIALEEADRVDSLFLERVAIAVEPRLRLIAAEESFDAEVTITEAGVARVLDLLLQKFNFIVADIPMPLPVPMHRIAMLARQVVVVLTPDVASLRDTQAIRQLVLGLTGADRVITVLNRADMKGGLELPMIEKALGIKPDVVIPDLGKRMLEAINLGVPAVQRVPALRRHLAPLLREIAGVVGGSGGRSWLRRLFGR